MALTRRTFLKSVAAASSLTVVGLPLGLFKDDVYYMRPGEILRDLDMPPWAEIVMANNCRITMCTFEHTQISVPAGVWNCLIDNCVLSILHRDMMKHGGSLVYIG